MAVYTHSKLSGIDNRAHRRFGQANKVVGKSKATERTKRIPRSGGKSYVRSVNGLRTRFINRTTVLSSGAIAYRGDGVVNRKYGAFGGPIGTVLDTLPAITGDHVLKRSNTSVGSKILTRP